MKKLVFYKCQICGNVVVKLVDSKVSVFCCGQAMTEIKPNTTDAAVEKHKPVITADGKTVQVKVGQIDHPMTEEHYISMIVLETNKGFAVKNLMPGQTPAADFILADDEKIVSAYSYCNLHGMWA